MVANFQQNGPGLEFSLVGEVVEHHDRIRFNWRMTNQEGAVLMSGLDCVRLGEDGRIVDLAGFFDASPTA